MRTVLLTTGDTAIPVITKTYLTLNRLVSLWTANIMTDDLTLESKKSEILKRLRKHIRYNGLSIYQDWQEEDDAYNELFNKLYAKVMIRAKILFPELVNNDNNEH